jgi:hypothetical protein
MHGFAGSALTTCAQVAQADQLQESREAYSVSIRSFAYTSSTQIAVCLGTGLKGAFA